MTSFNLHGIQVSNGIAIGKAYLISNALLEVVRYQISKKEISEKKVDYEELYDTMMVDHPMLRIMCEQTYNVDLDEDDVKVISNYIDGIK